MLCLPSSDPKIPAEGRVSSKVCIHQKLYEQAGFSFDRIARMLSYLKDPQNQNAQQEAFDDMEAEANPIDVAKMNAKRRKKSITVMRTQDFYELLNIDEERHNVTEDIIRKNYKKLALLHHPDKHEEGKYDDVAKEQFLKVSQSDSRSVRNAGGPRKAAEVRLQH